MTTNNTTADAAPLASASPDRPEHVFLDLSAARRVFVFGDLHGCLDLVRAQMARVKFSNDDGDLMISLGDLIDRGPDTLAVGDWIREQGAALLRIRGNHEALLHGHVVPGQPTGPIEHYMNGGKWAVDATTSCLADGVADLDALLHNAPVALTIITPRARLVGFVHADVPAPSWRYVTDEPQATWHGMVAALTSANPDERADMAHAAMWNRDRFHAMQKYTRSNIRPDLAEFVVAGIDHVFFGHSIVKNPVTIGNCSWLDTGAFASRTLTFVEVDEWLDAHASRA